jgi:hypothetical protein
VLAIKFSVEFFDLCHQIGIKSRNLNTRFAKPEFPAAAYPIVWIKHPNHDTFYSSFNYAVSAGDLRMIT